MASEVVIVGAGIVGCATAYFLAREGVSVTVLDAVGVAAAASGRNNGLVEHPYDAATAPLFEETVVILREALGPAIADQPVGTLLVAQDESAARGLVEHHMQFPALEPWLLDPDESRRAEPLLGPGIWGCMLRTGYPIDPGEGTRAFAALARHAGARFVLGEDAQFRMGSTLPHADAVVIAAGAATAELLDGYVRADAITPLWGVIASVELPTRPRHPLIEGVLAVAQGGGPSAPKAPFTLLDSPAWLAVGSTMLEGPEPGAQEWAPRLIDRATRFVPSLERARVRSTLVCARPRSFDNRPILGRLPGHDRLWIGAGHGGRGMSLGPASGRMLAEAIIAGDDTGLPPELSTLRLSG